MRGTVRASLRRKKIEAGKLDFVYGNVRLAALIEHASRTLAVQVAERKLEVPIDVDQSVREVCRHAARLSTRMWMRPPGLVNFSAFDR
jgi:signal transduction histidine kinase